MQKLPVSALLILFNLDTDFGESVHCSTDFVFNVIEAVPLHAAFLARPVELVHQFKDSYLGDIESITLHSQRKRRPRHRLIVHDCSIAKSTVVNAVSLPAKQTNIPQLVEERLVPRQFVTFSVAVLDREAILVKFLLPCQQWANFG